MSIITVGIDLAKNIFAVHGVDENGKAALIEQTLPLCESRDSRTTAKAVDIKQLIGHKPF